VTVRDFTINAECNGYDGDATFEFTDGQVWKQSEYRYEYRYQYRPSVELDANGWRGKLKVANMSQWIAVERIR
jgi:hypothetical protein